ncbi:hypothetical protein HYS94_03025 [Candidatus Daviesbacteria bacterium]|nr:hypothetical protein [Candidatus Daviesbacteria bacterium]
MTLTQTAILTKRLIAISIITLILGTISFIGYKIWQAYELANRPPVEEKPNRQFGSLPAIDFPKTQVSSSNFSYSLDTATGSVPKVGIDEGFEKIIKVYFLPKPYASLLSFEKTQELAARFNILTPPQILTEINYRFVDGSKILNIDLDSGNFKYSNEATSSAESLADDESLISDFRNVLNDLKVFRENLNGGPSKVISLKKENSRLISTNARVEAQAALISLWPKALDKKPIFTADFNKSLINATVFKSANQLENYLSLNLTNWQVDETTFATYPTKSAEIAFEDLKSGKGVIILEPNKSQVSITSIYLGYYLPENYNLYLQPIYIFEGPNFVAYVSAVGE